MFNGRLNNTYSLCYNISSVLFNSTQPPLSPLKNHLIGAPALSHQIALITNPYHMRSGVTGETCKITGVYKCMGQQVLTVELKAGEAFPLHNTYGTVCWVLRQRL